MLGSSVSITLWHPQRRIGGMCHFLLPRRPLQGEVSARYADDVLRLFQNAIQETNTTPSEYRASLFGGADLRAVFAAQRAGVSHGDANVVAGRLLLSALRLCIESHDIGGTSGRRLRFDLDSGRVSVARCARPTELLKNPSRCGLLQDQGTPERMRELP